MEFALFLAIFNVTQQLEIGSVCALRWISGGCWKCSIRRWQLCAATLVLLGPCVLPLRTLCLENGEDGALGGGFHAGAVGFCKGACV